jgi:AraC-like DNA-binding protein
MAKQNKNIVKKTPKKNGRPKIPIDFELVDNLAKIFCTGEEIASVLNVSYDTLSRRVTEDFKLTFADYIKSKVGEGKASLRRLQYKAATNGNTSMLIWLGKQYLEQTEPMRIIKDESDENNLLEFKGW